MSSHIIHVLVEIDEGWTDEAVNSAVGRIAENIAEEVENNWSKYGAFTVDHLPCPHVTDVKVIP